MVPLKGVRYSCAQCKIDLCGACEMTNKHAEQHAMTVIRQPNLAPQDPPKKIDLGLLNNFDANMDEHGDVSSDVVRISPKQST